MIVVATWPLMLRVRRLLGDRHGLAVTVMTITILIVIAVPLALAGFQLAEHADDVRAGLHYIATHSIPPPPEWVARLPLMGASLSEKWLELSQADPMAWLSPLTPYAGGIATWVAARAGSLGAFAIHLLLIVFLCAVLYAGGEAGAQGVLRVARRVADQQGVRTIVLATQAIRAVALGIVVTAIAQSVMAGAGLALAGVPYAGLLTVLMFVLCLAQIGAVPILLPATIWLFWRGDTGWGVFMVVWIVVVSLMDNVLRPMLIRRGADVPLLLIMAGVIGGLLAFGGVGLFVGPVVLAVMYTLLIAWVNEGSDAVPGNTVPAKPAKAVKSR
jgi:predicted PurR-regulated permease PerM